MNDARNNHSTRRPRSRGPLLDDGDLTPAQAIRQYGPPELVAEIDRLVEIEAARLFPPPLPAGKTEWDRQVTELIRQYPGAPEKVTAELNRRLAAPAPGEREWNLELTRVETKSALSDCLTKLWRYLTAEGTAGRLLFSYQPTNPAAARVTIFPDRCRYLGVLSPGTLFGGTLAIAMHSMLRNPAMPDTLRLDGHELRHARVRPASAEVAIRARLADFKQPPTYTEARLLAATLDFPQRAVERIIQDQIQQGKWPERKRGRRPKPPVAAA